MESSKGKSIATLILGIASIVLSWGYGIPGIIAGIIGLVLGNKALPLAEANGEPTKMAKTGRTLSIIGLILGIVLFVFYLGCTICTVCLGTGSEALSSLNY